VHAGDMYDAERSMQTLARWIDDNGYRSQGYAREVTLQFDPDNPANWVHEFQIPVTR
jgi:effector-binding domain-containing protein